MLFLWRSQNASRDSLFYFLGVFFFAFFALLLFEDRNECGRGAGPAHQQHKLQQCSAPGPGHCGENEIRLCVTVGVCCADTCKSGREKTPSPLFDDRPDKTDNESTQQHLTTLKELYVFLNTHRTHIWCRYRSLPAELLTLFNQDNLSKPSIIRKAASFMFTCLNECPRWFVTAL